MTALIVALLSVTMALPAGATLCEPAKAHCAAMPPAMKALCGRIGPTMDCCTRQQQSTPARPASDEQAPLVASPDAVAALPVAPVLALATASPVALVFSRDAALHPLGLFTLHSVFRI